MARKIAELKENVPQPAQQMLDDILLIEEPLLLKSQSADPAGDPAPGYGWLWHSDGSGTGIEGDLVFKWRDAADTTTTTQVITKL